MMVGDKRVGDHCFTKGHGVEQVLHYLYRRG